MRISIVYDVDRQDVPLHVPASLHAYLPPATSGFPKRYDLLVLDPWKTVRGRDAKKALARYERTEIPLLVVARTLTAEATTILSAASSYLVYMQGSIRTDQSDYEIRTLIGTKVKGPDHR
jgi:hypothetical protein